MQPHLPAARPRYLMGVGTPDDLLEAVERGVDMFDCVLPSRNARHGLIYTRNGIMNMKNAKWRNDFTPLDDHPTAAPTSQTHTKAYVAHLFRVNELLGPQLATLQNLAFYLSLVTEAREHIMQGDFTDWAAGVLAGLERRF